MPKAENRMYLDRKQALSCIVGCKFDCIYCEATFKRQLKRQRKNCPKCYDYLPHFHPERLKQKLKPTSGDEFIWIAPNGDIAFAHPDWLHRVYKEVIKPNPDKQFFFQTKDPTIYRWMAHPKNVWFAITLETDQIEGYERVSKAPNPLNRYMSIFKGGYDIHIDMVTIEPIIDFNLEVLTDHIFQLNPQRVYVGYDSHPCGLKEPSLDKTLKLIERLERFTWVKPKLLREAI